MKDPAFTFGRTCRTKKLSYEKTVQNGLSLTPSQIQRMSERGIPVSTQNLDGMFYDGDVRPSWDIPLDQQRGIDVAAMWQRRKDLGAKVNKNISDIVDNAR